MTGWYFVVVFLVFSSLINVVLPGTLELVPLFVLTLGALAFYFVRRLDKLQNAEASLELISRSGFFIAALETSIERVSSKRLCADSLSERELMNYWDNVHLLPILAAVVSSYSSSDARAAGAIEAAELLYDECTKKSS
jgi:hypothetical protein